MELFSRFLAPLIRHVLTGFFGWLVLKGWYSGEEGTALVTDLVGPIVGFVGTVAWSWLQKFYAAKLVQAALALPPGSSLQRAKDASGVKALGFVFLALSTLVATGACNKVPPLLDPYGAAAFRVEQVLDATDLIGTMVVKAEKSGFVAHKDTLVVADVVARVHEAGADLGRAFQAGAGKDEARAKAVAIIRQALAELPSNLSPRGQEIVKRYVTLALAILDLIPS